MNQSIIIGDDIEVMIVEIHGDQVKIGVKAPRQITVHRKEVYEQIQRQNIEAAAASHTAPDVLQKSAEILKLRKKEPAK